MARRSARDKAKQLRQKPQPRQRAAAVQPWGWVDVIWLAAALLIARILMVLTLGNQFTALMPDEGVVGVRIVMLIVFYLMILAVLAYRAHCRNLSFAEAYRLKKPVSESAPQSTPEGADNQEKHWPVWKVVLITITAFFILRSIAIVYTYVTGEFGWVTPPADSLTDLFGPSLLGLAAAIITIVILAPFIEELVFRVIMFDTFARKISISVAVILQGAIFSLYHFSFWAAIPNFLLALACVYLIQRCKTAIPAIVLHVLYNATVVAAAFYLAMM